LVLRRGKDRKEVELPSGCYWRQQPQNMRPLPGAERGNIKKKGKKRKRKNKLRDEEHIRQKSPMGLG
jgi:hypothetical protein